MLPECPDDLKHLLPYLQRSSEMKNRDSIVSYYCGFYAANLAIQRGYPKTPENETFLMALLDELGVEKEELKNEPALQDNATGKAHMLQFASKIFLAADNEDRSGHATKKTARLFLISSQFLEVIRVFGDAGEEIEDRIKYAKWKATDIIKALNEGRLPIAGPPGSMESPKDHISHISNSPPTDISPEFFSPSAVAMPPPIMDLDEDRRKSSAASERNLPSLSGTYDDSQTPTGSHQTRPSIDLSAHSSQPIVPPQPHVQHFSPPPPIVPVHHTVPPPQPPTYHAPPAPPPMHHAPPPAPVYSQFVSPHATFDQAEKHCRYAISAMQFEDIATSIREMETAIAILQSLRR